MYKYKRPYHIRVLGPNNETLEIAPQLQCFSGVDCETNARVLLLKYPKSRALIIDANDCLLTEVLDCRGPADTHRSPTSTEDSQLDPPDDILD